MHNAQWWVRGGNIARMGPYETQRKAWESLRRVDPKDCPYPDNAMIWPEWDDESKRDDK